MVWILTGLRRGELLALRWSDVDLDVGTLSVARTVEEVRKQEVRFKVPKTAKSRRRIDLPALAVAALKRHKAAQAELRLALGAGYQDGGLLFTNVDGSRVVAGQVHCRVSAHGSEDWNRTRPLPRSASHARHATAT